MKIWSQQISNEARFCPFNKLSSDTQFAGHGPHFEKQGTSWTFWMNISWHLQITLKILSTLVFFCFLSMYYLKKFFKQRCWDTQFQDGGIGAHLLPWMQWIYNYTWNNPAWKLDEQSLYNNGPRGSIKTGRSGRDEVLPKKKISTSCAVIHN